jgi:microtubule-associated protein-like 6
MGADVSKTSRSDINPEDIKLKELSPKSISKLRRSFLKNPSSVKMDRSKLISFTGIGPRESDILFEYFDMDGDGKIDDYELTCALAMVIYSSIELKSEFIFKLYDFDSNNFLTKDELYNLVITMTLYKKNPIISSNIDEKTDVLLREADLDLDKKLSMKEFQAYAYKNKEIIEFLNAYEFLVGNPYNDKSTIKKEDSENENEEKTENEKESDIGNDTYNKKSENIDENSDVNESITNNNNDNINEDFEEDLVNLGDEGIDPDLKAELDKDVEAKKRNEEIDNIKKGVEYSNGFLEEVEAVGDQFGAIKPWMTNVVNCVPSNYKKSKLDGSLPDAKLELEFVHGYRCHDTRNNLRYTKNGNFVYHTASVGIVYNKENHSQLIFNEHFDDITALAIHPNKKYVATGEIGPYPLISIWNTETGEAKVRIRQPLQKGINHLCFSQNGKLLCATAADDEHNIAIFEWEKGTAESITRSQNHRLKVKNNDNNLALYSTAKGGRANILGVCFNKNGKKIACCCVKEVNIFEVNKGKMKKTKCTGLKGAELTSIMCCGYLNDTLLCGSINGNLLVCSGKQFTKTKKAHKNGLNCIYIKENDLGFLTGGGDGLVLIWDNKLNNTNKISIKTKEINSMNYKIRSVCTNDEGDILIGTRGGEILEIEDNVPKVCLRGHFDGELWGLCTDPKKDLYYTVGEDKLLGVWDVQTKKLKLKCVLEEKAKTVDCSPDCKELAVGCESGNFYIYDTVNLKVKYRIISKESKKRAIQV